MSHVAESDSNTEMNTGTDEDTHPADAAINSTRESLTSDTDVVIKAESHMSTADLREELELIRTGAFEAIVFEGARESIEEVTTPSLSDRILGFAFFFLAPLYTNNRPLLAAAGRTDTTPYYTRERDGEIVNELPGFLPTLVYAVFGGFITFTLIFSVPQSIATTIYGINITYRMLSLMTFTGAFAIPITVRVFRNKYFENVNRNQLMANQIAKAGEETEGDVLAIVGADHASDVHDRLPSDLTGKVIPPDHDLISRPGVREFGPGILKVLILFVGVWGAMEWLAGTIILLIFIILIALF